MKVSLASLIALLALALVANSCKEQPNEVIVPPNEPDRWQAIPEFASLSIRYMLQHNNTLYLSARDTRVNLYTSTGWSGDPSVVYKTTDGQTWTKIAGFYHEIGPMTMHGDTLYALCSDTIFKMLPNGEWQRAIPTPGRLADGEAVGDMIFYRDSLYAMQSWYQALQTFVIYPDGTYREILPIPATPAYQPYAGAKFLKQVVNNQERLFVRGKRAASVGSPMFTFDGWIFRYCVNGLSEREKLLAPVNSMTIKNDTVYAGFMGPAGVKRLVNDHWEPFKDTLPNWEHALNVRPNLITETTGIVFVGERLFVSTQCMGVLEWRDSTGWQAMSEGLLKGFIPGIDNTNLYTPVVFFEHFKGKLFAGYGSPGFAPYGNQVTGLYRWDVK
jgi:hypothetical protein